MSTLKEKIKSLFTKNHDHTTCTDEDCKICMTKLGLVEGVDFTQETLDELGDNKGDDDE